MDDVYEIRGGHRLKRFIAIWILLSAGLNIWQMDRIAELEKKKPMVIYKADNAGAEIFGKVVEKRTTWQAVYSDYQRLWDFRSH